MMNSCIACFFATEIEAHTLVKKLKIISRVFLKSSTFLLGFSPSKPDLHFLIVKTGIGPRAALEAAQYAFKNYSIRESWIFGFAAGTDKKIASGSALIATQIGHLSFEPEKWINTDSSLKEQASKIASESSQEKLEGFLLTVETTIHSAEEKMKIGDEKGVIGLEMEAFPIAFTASKSRIPVMEVRWVLDEADYHLPGVEKFVEESGKWKPLTTFSTLIQHPALILKLPSFLRKVMQVSKKMKLFLNQWFDEK